MNKFIPLIFAAIIIASCVNSNSLKDEYLIEIKSKIDINKLNDFKKTPIDSALFKSQNISEQFIDLYESPKYKQNLDAFFTAINIPEDDHAKICFLTFALHAKLNNNAIQDDSIVNLCRCEFLKIEKLRKQKFANYKKLTKNMMDINNANWFVGDTILVSLPIREINGIDQVNYHQNSLDNYDYSKFIDSISITGIIINKNFLTYVGVSGLDTSEVVSQLKIIEASKNEFYFFGEKFFVYDTIYFHFGAYGRLIKGVSNSR